MDLPEEVIGGPVLAVVIYPEGLAGGQISFSGESWWRAAEAGRSEAVVAPWFGVSPGNNHGRLRFGQNLSRGRWLSRYIVSI